MPEFRPFDIHDAICYAFETRRRVYLSIQRKASHEANPEKRKEQWRRWYEENGEAYKDVLKARHVANPSARKAASLRNKYGIQYEDYLELLEQQGGVCCICGSDRPEHLDHDHETGAVRGVLCRKCNVGIGHFNDEPRLIEIAAKYLKHAPKQPALFVSEPKAKREIRLKAKSRERT